MKKGLILLLLLFTLTGCKPKTDEVEVCKEECTKDYSLVEATKSIYNEKMVAIYEKLAPNRSGEVYHLSDEEFHDREDIAAVDAVSENWGIPYNRALNQLDMALARFYRITQQCKVIEDCETDYVYTASKLTEYDYGYNDDGGYLYFEGYDNENNLTIVESIKFNFDGNYGNFDWYVYSPTSNYFVHEFMFDGDYYKYQYFNEDLWSYYHIDINNQRIELVEKQDGKYGVIFVDAEEIKYHYNDTYNFYVVSEYNNMEFVSSLSISNGVYELSFDFQSMDGWDRFYKSEISGPEFYDKLYLGDDEVFTEYNVFTHREGARYFKILTKIRLEESDLSTYTFPSEFTGEVTFSQLHSELEYLLNLENPFDLISITENELTEKFNEYLTNYEKEYVTEE